jgi:hypothetical protein
MKTFRAIYDNVRTVRNEDNSTVDRHYYRIIGMSEQEKAVYKSDKGVYYVESKKDGSPCYSVDANIGDELPIKRASKPNEKTGRTSWYHGQSEMQILNSLVEAFPAIAKVNMTSLETKAKKQYEAQYSTVAVAVEQVRAADEL